MFFCSKIKVRKLDMIQEREEETALAVITVDQIRSGQLSQTMRKLALRFGTNAYARRQTACMLNV